MARQAFAMNVGTVLSNGTLSAKEGSGGKRLGADSNTDDVVLSFNPANVKTRTNLRQCVEQLLQLALGGNELTP